jgi:predicted transposase/invertase (TIGR01784 family)
MPDHDRSYKRLFSHPELVRDLLTGFVHEEWVKRLDLSSLEKVNGSYVAEELREREDDIVWRVRWADGWVYVYLLLEFQSNVDKNMAVRLLAYIALLYQDIIDSRQLLANGKLPPVVLYNGKPPWNAALQMSEMIETIPGGLEAYRPQLRYLVIDEGRVAESAMPTTRNLTAALFKLEQGRTPEDLRRVVHSLVEWLKAPDQGGLRRDFTTWLKRVLLPARIPGVEFPEASELQEVENMLEETVKDWVREWKREGMQEGMEKGMQKGVVTVLKRQMLRRYGSLPQWAVTRLEQADTRQLEEWSERIFDARTLDDLLH